MEFEEMQKIWVAGSEQPLYAINERALQNRIAQKRNRVLFVANTSELLLIIVNFCASGFVFSINIWGGTPNIFMNVMAVWMFVTAGYVFVSRLRRQRQQPKFDRPMRDDLRHAIATATYQVRLSQLMRLNVLPIAALIVLGAWQAGKPLWVYALVLPLFAVAYFLGGWEQRIYKAKKRELEMLQTTLEDGQPQ